MLVPGWLAVFSQTLILSAAVLLLTLALRFCLSIVENEGGMNNRRVPCGKPITVAAAVALEIKLAGCAGGSASNVYIFHLEVFTNKHKSGLCSPLLVGLISSYQHLVFIHFYTIFLLV